MAFPKPRRKKPPKKATAKTTPSKRNSSDEREYRQLRAEYLKAHPFCELAITHESKRKALHIHHRKGRGPYLNVTGYWLALCPACHTKIHSSPRESYRKGWLLKRN